MVNTGDHIGLGIKQQWLGHGREALEQGIISLTGKIGTGMSSSENGQVQGLLYSKSRAL